MAHLNQQWLESNGVKAELEQQAPQGSDLLLWGLRESRINQQAYTEWASQHYELPAIRPDFFALAVDFSLVEKYSNIYSWESFIYPIYQWENTLFVACLQPVELPPSDLKVCFVIAPLKEMETAWERFQERPAAAFAPPPPPPPPVATKPPAPPADLEFSFDNLDVPPPPPQESLKKAQEAKTKSEPLPSEDLNLDFSGLEGGTQPEIGQFTSATQTMHAEAAAHEASVASDSDLPFPDLNFDKLTTAEIQLEGEKTKAPHQTPSAPKAAKPAAAAPPSPPPAVREQTVIDREDSQSSTFGGQFPDEYTPVPFITQEDAERFSDVGSESIPDKTLTDYNIPNHTPNENAITIADMNRCKDLTQCHVLKDVVSHIFGLLRKDYKRMMWLSINESRYYPKFVHGTWGMETKAWHTEVNLKEPNIFRIVSVSNLPFHGEVRINPINQEYFNLWCGGKIPNLITIYPVCDEDNVIQGFFIGFSKGEEFDLAGSLRKVENLISICRPSILAVQGAAAA